MVLLLVGDQEFREAPVFERREAVLPAPDGINLVELLRANLPFWREANVVPGLHKEQHVVGVLLNRFPVGTGTGAFGEAEMIRYQTLQTLKGPEEDICFFRSGRACTVPEYNRVNYYSDRQD